MDTRRESLHATDALAAWREPVSHVRFVDAARVDAFGRLDVRTVEDLLRHYPARYLDLTRTAPLARAPIGQDVTVVGTVHEVIVKKPRPRLTVTQVALVDDSGVLLGVWFNQPYIAQRFREGERVAFAGTVALDYGLRQIKNPFFEKLTGDAGAEDVARILPIHRATEGLSTNWIRRLVTEALDEFGDVPDFLPLDLRLERGLISLADALHTIHFPETLPRAEDARRRLAYDELLTLSLGMALRRHALVEERPGVSHRLDGARLLAYRDSLPFELTGDQRTAIREVLADMRQPHPMNRMLLGDVGSGKTVVAGAAMAAAADSAGQAAMMAPTEVLAEQYANKLGPLLDAAGVTWALLTGSTATAERRRILGGLADGSIQAAFGTHALISEDVAYANLTLAVVDEQHRFGVGQRLRLRAKGEAPDLLVMTATPIPRSLALTLYGDLAASYLRERPGGRSLDAHVTTQLVPRAKREDAYERVRATVRDGHQAYVVCALVEESESSEAKAAVKEAERLQRKVFPDLRVGLLTGQMRPAEKMDAMHRFRNGEIDVLVATTVIEVGVDVQNATVMLIEDADRFGLAQLHQLRGRVGRGEAPGEVLLFADPKTDQSRARMDALVSTHDGFALAEEDMRLRGEGQLLGERQHGLPELRLASLIGDLDLLEAARADAAALVEADPRLEAPQHAPLAEELRSRFSAEWEWVSSG